MLLPIQSPLHQLRLLKVVPPLLRKLLLPRKRKHQTTIWVLAFLIECIT
jgi:hypothetical protein